MTKRRALVVVFFLLFIVMVALFLRPRRSQPAAPRTRLEVQSAAGPVSRRGALERVELTTEIDPADPEKGVSRVQVRQAGRKGEPEKILAQSASFGVFQPQGNHLELSDLDGDGDEEIIVGSSTGEDRGELRIFNFQDSQLAWFCRVGNRAACIFPYRFNRPAVVDLDSDQKAEVVVYGPQPLADDQFNFDRYVVYQIYVFQDGSYLEAGGSKLSELSQAFARYSRLPLIIRPTEESPVSL